MGLPFMPLYTGDYEADTAHLTLEEDGFYMRFLRLLWTSPGCSVPDDPRWIMRRMRVDDDVFYRIGAPLIDEFCSKKNGKIYQRRLMEEWKKAKAKYEARKEAGKRGGTAKALKEKELRSSKRSRLPWQPEPEPDKEKKETKKRNFSPPDLSTKRDSDQSIIDFRARQKARGA